MKAHSIYVTTTATCFLLLSLLHISNSQIVGCDNPSVQCPTKDDATDGGICSVDNGNIGVVSFDNNVSSSGPLTWTITQTNDEGGNSLDPYVHRSFWLGYPPQLDLQNVTDYAACSMILFNVSSALQVPDGFDDFGNFGCPTVLGSDCSTDILSRVREEFVSILDEGFPDYNPSFRFSPCVSVYKRLVSTPLPESCDLQVKDNVFKFGEPRTLTNNTEGVGFWYQTPDSCSMTTGGADYLVYSAAEEESYEYFHEADLNSEDIERFRNGTTPIFTFFYNEPWNADTTGPASFLAEPEVHLHCLRTMPSTSEDYTSESAGGHIQSGYLWLLLPIVGIIFGV